MNTEFVSYFRNEIDQVQQYAQEHRQGNDKNRRELDRRISIILRRFYPAVEESLGKESEDPWVEARRIEHLRWKKIFLQYTSIVKILVMVLTIALILVITLCGAGSPESQLAYKCYFAAAIAVFGLTSVILYRFKQSTKEFLIENILAYSEDDS